MMDAYMTEHVLAEAGAHVRRYLARFPHAQRHLQTLQAQLEQPDHDLFSRSNMRGHITASVLMLDLPRRQVLLVHHRASGRWLQPGGHFEPGPAAEGSVLLASGLREAREEAGAIHLRHLPWHPEGVVPLDIDSHPIAARPSKREGDHTHHDFQYLVLAESAQPTSAQEAEVYAARWAPVDELAQLGSRLSRTRDKLKALRLVV